GMTRAHRRPRLSSTSSEMSTCTSLCSEPMIWPLGWLRTLSGVPVRSFTIHLTCASALVSPPPTNMATTAFLATALHHGFMPVPPSRMPVAAVTRSRAGRANSQAGIPGEQGPISRRFEKCLDAVGQPVRRGRVLETLHHDEAVDLAVEE